MMKLFKYTLTIFFVTFIMIALVESGLRITSISEPATYFPEIFAAENPGDWPPEISQVNHDKNGTPYKFNTNKLGFRTTGALIDTPEKRILCIGDSFTQGIIDDEKSFPYLLQQKVIENNNQVYNAGVPGFTMEDELSYLREKGLKVNPDVIVLAFCKNDFTDYHDFWRKSFRRAGQGAWRDHKIRNFVKKNLHVMSLAKKIRIGLAKQELKKQNIRNIAFDLGEEEHALSDVSERDKKRFRDMYARDFESFFQICSEKGIRIIPVIFPSAAQLKGQEDLQDQKILRDLFNSYGLTPIDIYSHVSEFPVDSVFIKGDGHPTGFTNRIVADLLLEELSN